MLVLHENNKDIYGEYRNFSVSGVKLTMRWIPSGSFIMGSEMEENKGISDDICNTVTITKGFWMAEAVCTQELWVSVMGWNPSHFKGNQRPVETVSWHECQLFLEKINKENDGLYFRLPTDAEWEYSCRAGKTATPYSFGKKINNDQANFNSKCTVIVNAYSPNSWGLYQMHGNVWEWCSDCYEKYDSNKTVDPEYNNRGSRRILRGGSFANTGWSCRSSIRIGVEPSFGSRHSGFRLVSVNR